MRHTLVSSVVLAAALIAAVNAEARSYILVANGNNLPAKLEAALAASGGTVTHLIPEIGIAVVESSNPAFAASAAKIGGIGSVLPNATFRPNLPEATETVDADDADAVTQSHTTVPTDPWTALQWGHEAIDAGGAWAAGYFGQGVRVAVLDSGVAAAHVDIAPNLNTALSTSFVPGEAYNVTGTGFNHGTHVAGIIAAARNGIGTIGVAPKVELVAVKVLSAATGSGSFGGIIAGIVYAASIEADVVNMSLGAEFPRSGFWDDNNTPANTADDVWVSARDITSLINATDRATTYAYQKGCTIVVAAGNSGVDRDHDANYWVVPADGPHVMTISATGPMGWALDPAGTSLDDLASYSNYGQSRITFAAPGGDGMYPGNDISVVGGITQFTWVFDLVFAPSNRVGTSNRYSWSAGTSMAAPHASAVAALIIGKNGGKMSPSHVMQAMRASVDDLGKPGNDDVYGAGRVNAAKAVAQ